jgi:hypothetical protein
MFFHFDMTSLYAIGGPKQPQPPLSALDGLPVFSQIFMLNMDFSPPASQWTPVFQVPAEYNLVQMQACATMINRLRSGSKVALCTMTNTSGFLNLVQFDLTTLSTATTTALLLDLGWNVTTSRVRFETELVTMVQDRELLSGFPDLLVGAPKGIYQATILYISFSMLSSPLSLLQWQELPFPSSSGGGIGCFRSMAFTADKSTLFAVDEQPAIWRWKFFSASRTFEFVYVQKYVKYHHALLAPIVFLMAMRPRFHQWNFTVHLFYLLDA